MKEKNNDFLTLREASQYLRISKEALYDLVRSRKIPSFKVGSQWRLRKSSIDRWAERKESARMP